MTEFGSEESYNRCYDSFMALHEEVVVHNNVPAEIATAEARELAVAAEADRDVLLSMGLAPELIDSLADRAGAYTYAVSRHNTALAGDPEALANWKAAYPQGYELRKYLMRFAGFAYRKDKNLTARVDEIRKGHGHRDLIADLLDIHILASDHPEPLKLLPAFDETKVAEAKEMHNTLATLLARASVDPKTVQATRDVMNRAWTWFRQAADEVKAAGQFAFEGTDRYSNYVSEYRQNLSKKGAALAPDEESPQAEAV